MSKLVGITIPNLRLLNSSIEGLVKIIVPGDGSCLFHSIFTCFSLEYNSLKQSEREKYILKVRNQLSIAIEFINPNTMKIYYEEYGNGNLSELGKMFPQYSLRSLQKLLNSKKSVGEEFIEPLSNFLNLDIYIIDLVKKDVYITDLDMYKNRNSVVIGYFRSDNKKDGSGHYDSLGIYIGSKLWTLFNYDHFLIKSIRSRIKFKTKK